MSPEWVSQKIFNRSAK